MSMRRSMISLLVFAGGIALMLAGGRVAAADGAVTVGPDFQFHDGANSSSTQTTITAGESVVFTWTGGVPHSVTADDGSFDSGVQTSGTFSRTFTSPGTYRYYCSVHGAAGGIGMSGVITVLAASTPTATATQAAATATSTPAGAPSATKTPAATTTAAASTTAAPTATPGMPGTTVAGTTPAPSSTPAAAVSAGGSLPAAGGGGAGRGSGRWLVWGGLALAVVGAGGMLAGARKLRAARAR